MEEVFSVGETYTWRILSIEAKSHRLGLLPVKTGTKAKEAKTAL
jgi:hypothetical protein